MNATRHLARCAALAASIAAGPAAALQIDLPVGAQLTAERTSALDSFDAPVGVFSGAEVPSVTLEGAIERRAWRISSSGLTPLQVMAPLRTQLAQQGFDPIFECEAETCGGFDFRFKVEVLPAPNMYVNISDFRYLTAVLGNPSEPQAAVSVLVSVTRGAAYVQIFRVETAQNAVIEMPLLSQAPHSTAPPPATTDKGRGLGELLLTYGHAALAGLEFSTGTSELGTGPFPSLADLAGFMQEEPGFRILLVGHTDTIGALESNIALSRARAASVRDRLIADYGIEAERIDAEGMGYLSPIASNLTEEGRQLNRRVEAVLLEGR